MFCCGCEYIIWLVGAPWEEVKEAVRPSNEVEACMAGETGREKGRDGDRAPGGMVLRCGRRNGSDAWCPLEWGKALPSFAFRVPFVASKPKA